MSECVCGAGTACNCPEFTFREDSNGEQFDECTNRGCGHAEACHQPAAESAGPFPCTTCTETMEWQECC